MPGTRLHLRLGTRQPAVLLEVADRMSDRRDSSGPAQWTIQISGEPVAGRNLHPDVLDRIAILDFSAVHARPHALPHRKRIQAGSLQNSTAHFFHSRFPGGHGGVVTKRELVEHRPEDV
jgi:hypothetical protein